VALQVRSSLAADAERPASSSSSSIYFWYICDMTSDEIGRLHSTQPFKPFRILVADGRQYDVRRPENLAMAGKGRLIAIGMPDHFVTLDFLLVPGIERPIPRGSNGKARKRS
jgi:hypothetical protein